MIPAPTARGSSRTVLRCAGRAFVIVGHDPLGRRRWRRARALDGSRRAPAKWGCMSDVVYVSRVRIERVRGAFRRACMPANAEPIEFGVHSDVAKHYGVTPDVERTTTLDYVVAAAVG